MSEPDLTDWIGNRESASDIVTPAKAAGMAALFDWPDAAAPGTGDPLPALWHWMFFAPSARQSEIGPDGHPARGGFMPPVPLPRRMFAGATMRFHDAIRVGDTITRDSEILSVEEKQGRTGPLVFVRVRHADLRARMLAMENIDRIDGFVLPKITVASLAASPAMIVSRSSSEYCVHSETSSRVRPQPKQ